MKVLLTGGSGAIGSQLIRPLGRSGVVFAPSRAEMDITNPLSVVEYVRQIQPDVIVHAAAQTDATASELERGDTNGISWKVNVEGTKHVVAAADAIGAQVIYISTGSVFAGTDQSRGPFGVSDDPSPDSRLSWYAITKKEGEKIASRGSIIRISHPTYISSILDRYADGSLYRLFTDVRFPITFTRDIAEAILALYDKKKSGIFHISSTTHCTPYELAIYVIHRAIGVNVHVLPTTFAEFVRTAPHPLRYSQYHALDSSHSLETLGMPQRTWQEVVDYAIPNPVI